MKEAILLYFFFNASSSLKPFKYSSADSLLPEKFITVLQWGHCMIGCLIIKSKVSPKGFLHDGQGIAINYYQYPEKFLDPPKDFQ